MVKNFLVVVKMEHVRGPKLVMVANMKFYVCVCVGGGEGQSISPYILGPEPSTNN